MRNEDLKVAIVHEFLSNRGGAEKVLETWCEMYPKADIFTLIYQSERYRNSIISKHKIYTSFIDRLPFGRHKYRNFLPLMPFAIEQFDLRGYDLVISNHYIVAHGVITSSEQLHVVNTCTPMKQVWSSYFEYINDPLLKNKLKRVLARGFIHKFRIWDSTVAQRIDNFIAISTEVSERIKRYYGKDSMVIFPPVDFESLVPKEKLIKEDYFLGLSRLMPMKRFDLMIDAFKQFPNKNLKIAGGGPEYQKLKERAKGSDNIELLGWVSENDKIQLYQKARAVLFCAYEDFGIVPVEAQAAGTPVIAYGKGGVIDTVVPGKTGVLFETQTVDSLTKAIFNFERMKFDRGMLIKNAKRFSKERFKKEFVEYVEKKIN